MRIPTTALLAISFDILGRSSAERAEQEDTHDGFGLSYYGFECYDRVYDKAIVYAMANHSCVTNAARPELKKRNFETAGFRTEYPIRTFGDDKGLLNPERQIVPIRGDIVFPFELDQYSSSKKDSNNEMFTMTPGFDRLVLDDDCIVLGILTDLDFPGESDEPSIEWCSVLKTSSDIEIPLQRSSRSPYRSRERYSDGSSRSRERYSDGSTRSRERYSDGSSRSQERYSDGSTRSRERYSDGSSRSRERYSDGSSRSRERYSDGSTRSQERYSDGSSRSQERYSDGSTRSRERYSDGSSRSRERYSDGSSRSRERSRDISLERNP